MCAWDEDACVEDMGVVVGEREGFVGCERADVCKWVEE